MCDEDGRKVISLSERRLDRLEGTLFGRSDEEQHIAAVISRIELCNKEQQTAQAYVALIDSGEVILEPDDGSEAPANCLAHLGDLLSNYDRLLGEQLRELEYERQTRDGPYQNN